MRNVGTVNRSGLTDTNRGQSRTIVSVPRAVRMAFLDALAAVWRKRIGSLSDWPCWRASYAETSARLVPFGMLSLVVDGLRVGR
jgi:hypothetical protein